jgi:hypothetical protein
MCGKDFEEESTGTFHILANHNALVYLEKQNANAIPYKDYLRLISKDVELDVHSSSGSIES